MKAYQYVGAAPHKSQCAIGVREAGEQNRYKQYLDTGEGYGKFLEEVRDWREQGQRAVAVVEPTGNTRYCKRRLDTPA
jgi:hypothetical protein